MDPRMAAARRAMDYITDGMVVGLGSGTTMYRFVDVLSDAPPRVLLVPTSVDIEQYAARKGLADLIRYPWQVDRIDVAVDGADEVRSDGRVLIKGGGAALVREKIVDYWSRRLVVIVDESKVVDRVPANSPVPVEVVPYAWPVVARSIESEMCGEATLRRGTGKLGPVVTDNGNYIIDWRPCREVDGNTEKAIKGMPGVVDSGIFASYGGRITVVVGTANGVYLIE